MSARSPSSKVLLVDDSWYVHVLIEELLSSDGYTVSSVRDGAQAIAACQEEPADVVLMDVVLPDTNGFDAWTAIRELNGDAQVVFMTGLLDDATRLQASESGGVDLVPKPVEVDRLKSAVREAFSRRHGPACELQAAG